MSSTQEKLENRRARKTRSVTARKENREGWDSLGARPKCSLEAIRRVGEERGTGAVREEGGEHAACRTTKRRERESRGGINTCNEKTRVVREA